MNTKTLLFATTLALVSLTAGYAKTYDIALSENSQAGNLQLKAGRYTLKVEGANAVFTDMANGKSYTAPVKIDQGAAKFSQTEVESNKEGATEQIQNIKLGGSTNMLEFGR